MKSLILVLAMVMLTACGGSSTESPNENDSQTGDSSTTERPEGNEEPPVGNEELPSEGNEEPPIDIEEPPIGEEPDVNWDQGNWNDFNWQ